MTSLKRAAVVGMLLLASVCPVWSQTTNFYYWTNALYSGTQNWSTAANWNTTNPPSGGAANDWIVFNAPGPTTSVITNNEDLSATFILNVLSFQTGAVYMTGGQLIFTNNGAALPVITNYSGSVETVNNNLLLGTNLLVGLSSGLNLGGVISGSGGLVEVGTGTLLLGSSVSNTYTGGTIVSNGVLRLAAGATNALGTPTGSVLVTVAQTGAALDLNGDTNIISYAKTIVISGYGIAANTGAVFNSGAGLTSQALQNLRLAGNAAIGQDGGNRFDVGYVDGGNNGYTLVKVGNSQVAIDGITNNLAGLTITNGTVIIQGGGLFGTSTVYNLAAAGSILQLYSVTQPLTNTLLLNAGLLQAQNGTQTWAGPVMLNAATANIQVNTSGGGGLFNITGALGGTGVLTKAGSYTLALSGANTNTGGILISAGAVQFNSSSALGGSGANVTNNAVMVFNYAGIQSSLSRVAPVSYGTLGLTTSNLNDTLNFNTAGLSNTFLGVAYYGNVLTQNIANVTPYANLGSGYASNAWEFGGGGGTLVITNNITGKDSVMVGGQQQGTNGYSLVLLAGSNTYTGATTLTNLQMLWVGAASNVNGANSNALAGTSALIFQGGTLALSNATINAPIFSYNGSSAAGVGILNPNGGQIMPLGGTTNYINGLITANVGFNIKSEGGSGNGVTYITGGILGTNVTVSIYSDAGSGSPYVITNNPINIGGNGNLYGHWDYINVGSNNVGNLYVDWGGMMQLGANNAFTNAPTLTFGYGNSGSADSLDWFDLNGHSLTVSSLWSTNHTAGLMGTNYITSATPATLTVTNGVGSNSLYNGYLTGAVMLVKSGAGTLIMGSNNDSYTGGTLVNGGVLQFNSSNAMGSLSSGANVTNNGGALAFNFAGFMNTATSRVALVNGGTLAQSASNASESIDFSGTLFTNAYLGAVGTVTNFAFTPNGTTYRLGGGGGTLVITNVIASGSVAIGGGGAGTVVLAAANSYAGGTVLNTNTLQISADAALGLVPGSAVTNLTVAGNSTLQAGGNLALSATRTILINSGVAFTEDSQGFMVTNNNALVGAGALVKVGSGTLILNNSGSTYGGGTSNNAGWLALGANNVLGAGPLLMNGGTLIVTNGGGWSQTNAVNLLVSSTVDTSGGNLALNGPVNGALFQLTKNGGNTLTLGGTTALTNLLVNAGTVQNTGTLTAYSLAGSGVQLSGSGALTNSGTIIVALNNDKIQLITAGAGYAPRLDNTGNILVGGAGPAVFVIGENGAGGAATVNNYFGGNILETAGTFYLGLYSTGTVNNLGGTLTISNTTLQVGGPSWATAFTNTLGTLNIYSGLVNYASAGTFQLGPSGGSSNGTGIINLNGGTLATAARITGGTGLNSTSLFNFAGGTFSGTVNGVTLLGTDLTQVVVQSGGAVVAMAPGVTDTISANLLNGGGGLTMQGPGALILSGTNAFTGGTLVTGGILQYNSTNAMGAWTGSANLTNNGGALAFNFAGFMNAATGRVALVNGGTLAQSANNAAESIVFTSALFSNAFLGAIGTVTNVSFTPNGTTSRFGGGGGTLVLTNAITSGSVVIGGGGGGLVVLAATNTYAGGTTLLNGGGTELSISSYSNLPSAGALVFNGGTLQITGTTLNNLNPYVNANWSTFTGGLDVASSGNLLTVTNAIGGTGSLTKLGAGTLALSGASSFSGGLLVSSGTVAVSGSGTLGLSNNAVTLNGVGVLLNLGGTTQTNGLLSLGNGVVSNGTLLVSGISLTNGNIFANLSNAPTKIAQLTMVGAGTTVAVLGGTNTYSGGTVLGGGELSVGAYTNLPMTGALTFTNGGILQITGTQITNLNPYTVNWTTFNGGFDVNNATNTLTVTNAITGGLVKLGAGTLVLGHSDSFSGGLLAGGGMLNLGGLVQTNGVVTLGGGGILTNGTLLASAYYLTNGAVYAALTDGTAGPATAYVVGSAGNTVRLYGTDTFSGGLLISGGTLAVTNVAALGASNTSVLVSGSGVLDLGGSTLTNFGGRSIGLSGGTLQNGTLLNSVFNTFTNGLIYATLGNAPGYSAALYTVPSGGTTILANANSYSGGTVVNTNSVLWLSNSLALGSGSITLTNGGNLRLSGGITLANAINMYNGDGLALNGGANYNGILRASGSTNYITGQITAYSAGNGGQPNVATENGGTLFIRGGIVSVGNASFSLSANSAGPVIVDTQPINLGTGSLYIHGSGSTNQLNVAGNTLNTLKLYYAGNLSLGVNNALPTNTTVYLNNGSYDDTNPNYLALNGTTQTIAGLVAYPSNSVGGALETLAIGAGQLTVNGNLTVGSSLSNSNTRLLVTGAGALLVNNQGGVIQIGNDTNAVSTITGNRATNDMSGLGTFAANLGVAGRVTIGSTNSNGGAGTFNDASTLLLATNSTITAGYLSLGDGDYNNSTQAVFLGAGQNVLNVNTVNVGSAISGRSSGLLQFNGTNGTLVVSNATGGRADMLLGGTQTQLGTLDSGVVNLAGHNVTLYLGNLILASEQAGVATTNTIPSRVAAFSFDTGTLDVTNVVLGARSSTFSNNGTPYSLATLNIGGGTSTIGQIIMATNLMTGNAVTGIVNLTGGSITVSNGITRGLGGTNALAMVNLSGSNTVLNMNGSAIGGAGTNFGVVLNLTNGTLMNLAQFNGGTTPVTMVGTGLLTLAGNNTYSGGTLITAGELSVGAYSNLPTGALTLTNGGILQITGTQITNLTPYTVNWTTFNGGFDVNNAANALTVTNNIQGTGALAKLGVGALMLNGSNSFSGGTLVSGGLLQYASTNAIGGSGANVTNNAIVLFNYAGSSGSVSRLAPVSTGTLALGASNLSDVINFHAANLSNLFLGAVGTITNNLANYIPYTTTNGGFAASNVWKLGGGGGAMVITNIIGGSDVVMIGGYSGNGTTTVQLAGNNTYSGTTYVQANDALLLTSTSAVGHTAGISLGGGTLELAYASPTNGNFFTNSAPITVTQNSAIQAVGVGTTNAYNLTGGIISTNNSSLQVLDTTLSNPIWLSGSVNLGTGKLTANNLEINSLNNNVGTLAVTGGGSIVLNAEQPFSNAPALLLGNAGGTATNYLDLAGFDLTVSSLTTTNLNAALAGNNYVTNSNGSAVLTVSNSVADTYNGYLTDGGAAGFNWLGLTKNGSGILTLTSTNPYVGQTVVAGGTLVIVPTGGLVNTYSILVQNGTLLLGSTNSVMLGANTNNLFNYGYWDVSANSASVGPTYALDQNFLTWLSNAVVLGQSSGLPGAVAMGANSTNSLDFALAGLTNISGVPVYLGGAGSSNVTYGGSATWETNSIYLGGAAGTLIYTPTIGGGTNLFVGPQGGYTGSVVVLTASNSFTGGTIIQSGTLKITNDFNLGAVPAFTNNNITMNGGVLGAASNSVALNPARGIFVDLNGGGFNVDGGLFMLVPGSISGPGAVTNMGAGTVVLSGSNTFSGGLVLMNGTADVSNDLALGYSGSNVVFNGGALEISGTWTNNRPITLLSGGGTFYIDGAQTLTLSNNLTGAGSLTTTGFGALALSGTNTYTGGTYINGSVIIFSSTNAIAEVGTNVFVNGGAVAFLFTNVINTVTSYVASITGGSVALTASNLNETINFHASSFFSNVALGAVGTLTNNLANYTPYITTNGGFAASNLWRLGGGGGTLVVTNTIGGSDGVVIGGGGGGTVVLSGSNSYTGGTTVNAGLFKLGSTNALGNPANTLVTVTQAGTFDLDGMSNIYNYTLPVVISGYGVATNMGAIINSSAANLTSLGVRNVALTGNAAVGNDGTRFDIGMLNGGNNGYTLVKVGNNQIAINGITNNLAGLVVSNGNLTLQTGPFGTSTVYTLATPSSTLQLWGGPLLLTNALVMNAGMLQNGNASNTWLGPVTLNGATNNMQVNANLLTVSGAVGGPGALTKSGVWTLELAGTNAYSGGTLVSAGALQFDSTNALVGTVTNNSVVIFNYSGIQGSLGNLAPVSSGSVALTLTNTVEAINFNSASLSNAFLGAAYGLILTNSLNNYTPYVNTGNGFASNRWMLGGGGGILVITNAIGGSDSVVVGGGLQGSSYGEVLLLGNSSYSGATVITNYQVLMIGTNASALGNTSGVNIWGGTLALSNSTVNAPINIYSGTSATSAGSFLNPNGAMVMPYGGTTNYINGLITFISSGSIKSQNPSGNGATGVTYFTGGMLSTNVSISLYSDAGYPNGFFVITNNPINLGSGNISGHYIYFNVGSNNVGGGLNIDWSGWMQLGAPNTFTNAPAPLNFGVGNSASSDALNWINLNGYNLAVSSLWSTNFTVAGQGTNYIYSPTAANLTVTNAAGSSSMFMGYITGAVALVKSGAGTLILNAPLNEYTNTTTVNGGTLVINPVGAMLNSAITVNNGSLVLGATNSIGANPLLLTSNAASIGASYAMDTNFVNWATNRLGFVPAAFALGANSSNNLDFSSAAFANTFLGGAGPTNDIYSGVINWGGTTLRLGGGAGILQYTNIISAGSNLVVGPVNGTAGGGVLLTAVNTYTNFSLVQSGTLKITNDLALGNGIGGTYSTNISYTTNVTYNPTNIALNITNVVTNTAIALNGGTFSATNITLNGGTLGASSNSVYLNSLRGITLGANGGGLAADTSQTLYVPGIVTGSGLTINGPGKVILYGVNTYTGGVTLSSGTLNVTNDLALGTAGNGAAVGGVTFNGGTLQVSSTFTPNNRAVTFLSGGGAISVDQGFALTITNAITGAGTVTNSGLGTLYLNGATNTFTGGLVLLNASTLDVTNDAPLGAVGIGVAGAGSLTFNGGTLEAGASFTLNNRAVNLQSGGGTLSADSGQTLSLSNVVSGVGGLTVAGHGTVILYGANTYAGGTTINGGTLDVTNDAPLGAAGNGATIGGLSFLNDGALQVSGTFTLNNRAVNMLSGGGTFNVDPNNTLTVTNTITGPGNLVKMGAGTLMLPVANTYVGGTAINGGTVVLGDGNLQLNGLGYGVVSVGSGSSTGLLYLTGNSGTAFYTTNSIILNNGTIFGNTGLQHLTGNLTVIGGGGTLLAQYVNNDLFVDGVLGGFGALTLADNSDPQLSFSTIHIGNASNTYSGLLTVDGVDGNGLRLMLDNNLALQYATVNLNGSNGWSSQLAFNTNVTAVSLGALAGSGNAVLQDAVNNAVNLTVGGNSSNTTYSGTLSGPGALIMNGTTNTMTLSGANTYLGGTTISNGMLAVGNNRALADAPVMMAGGSLGVSVSGTVLTNVFNLAGNATVDTTGGNLTLLGQLTNSGTLTVAGTTNTLILAGVNTYGGGTVLQGGTLDISNDLALGLGGTGLMFTNGGALEVSGTWTNTNRAITLQTGGGVFNVDASQTFTVNNALTGVGGLVKIGAGTQALGVANAYLGGTTVSNGVLQLSGGVNTLSTNGAITVAGGVLDLGGSVQFTTNQFILAGGILQHGTLSNSVLNFVAQSGTNNANLAGAVALVTAPAGTVVLLGASTYSGGTSNNAGTALAVGGNAVLGTGALVMNGGTLGLANGGGWVLTNTVNLASNTLVDTTGGNLTLLGQLTNSGALLLTGPNTLTLAFTNNTYGGGTTVSNGTLQLNSAYAAGSGTITINSGAILAPNFSNNTNFNAVAGAGTINVILNGETELYNLSGFTGTLNIPSSGGGSGRTDLLGNMGAGTVNVSNGATLFMGAGVTNQASLSMGGGGNNQGRGALLLGNNAVLSGNVTLTDDNGGAGVSLGSSNGWVGTISGAIGDGNNGYGISSAAAGGGTLVLSGSNTFHGATRWNSPEALILANQYALQNSTFCFTNGTLTFASTVATHAFLFGGLAGTNNLVLQDNAGLPDAVALTVGNNGASTTYGGALSGSGSLVKIGTGTLTVTGVNTYAGVTTVSNGTLAVNGSIMGGLITVQTNATLAGYGYAGNVTVSAGATLSPGNSSISNIYVGNLTLSNGALTRLEIQSATIHDMVTVSNSLTLVSAPQLVLALTNGWTQSANVGKTIVLFADAFAGGTTWNGVTTVFQLSDFGPGATDNGLILTNGSTFWVNGGTGSTNNQFQINYFGSAGDGTAGNDILLTVIPEPSSVNLMMMMGLLYWVRMFLNRRKQGPSL